MNYHLGRFSGLAIRVELFRAVVDLRLGLKVTIFRDDFKVGKILEIIRWVTVIIVKYRM